MSLRKSENNLKVETTGVELFPIHNFNALSLWLVAAIITYLSVEIIVTLKLTINKLNQSSTFSFSSPLNWVAIVWDLTIFVVKL